MSRRTTNAERRTTNEERRTPMQPMVLMASKQATDKVTFYYSLATGWPAPVCSSVAMALTRADTGSQRRLAKSGSRLAHSPVRFFVSSFLRFFASLLQLLCCVSPAALESLAASSPMQLGLLVALAASVIIFCDFASTSLFASRCEWL